VIAMTLKRALQVVLIVALLGVAFSGVLTYRDFAAQTQSCTPFAPPGTLFGYPPCVYGLVMYAVVAVIALWGLVGKR
jgi:hypothetical protein